MNKRGTESIYERCKTEEKAYKRLLKQAESNVLRREYWDCDSRVPWHWDPSEFCVEQIERPRKGHPKRTSKQDTSYHEYGYDASGRPVLFRTVWLNKPRKEHFIRYSGDMFAATTFEHISGHGILLDVYAEGVLKNGKTVQLESAKTGSKGWLKVTWEGDQPVRLLFADRRGEKPSLEWLFAKGGRLIGMYNLPRKLPKGVNLNSLTKTIHDGLIALIPTIVAKAKVNQPAYCLILGYDGEGNGAMPPTLSIGMDSERQQFIKENPKTAKTRIWSPDEFQHRLAKPREIPGDKKFEKACDWYSRILEQRGSEGPAHDLLNRVTAAVARMDWSKHLPVTEDFAVIAVDYEGADLAKNVKKSVSAQLQRRLKNRGLL